MHLPSSPHSLVVSLRHVVPYSENNPVPTIQNYEKDKLAYEKDAPSRSDTMNTLATSNGHVEQNSIDVRNEQTEEIKQEEEEGTAGLTEGQKEKKRMMDRMANQKKPIDTVKRRKGERLVDDPVTGQKVMIKDAQFKGTFLSRVGQIHSDLQS
jgi:hypothetical protein